MKQADKVYLLALNTYMYIRTIPLDLWSVRCRMANLKFSHENIGTVGCLQTNTALPQLSNYISWVSAEISWHKAQCIFCLAYFTLLKILFPNIDKFYNLNHVFVWHLSFMMKVKSILGGL